MNRKSFIDAIIIAWLIFVFVIYHLQYISLAHIFLETYAQRYAPFLIPVLKAILQ